MADPSRPAVFTVPLAADIVTELARNLIKQFRGDQLGMADVNILLPNNRARSALIEAFVREAGQGLLLPRMAAVGDLGLDDTLSTLVEPLAGHDVIAPAIGDTERRLLLARLIRKQRKHLTAVEALRLSTLLSRTIDQLEIEEVSPSQINDDHLEGELAQHWHGAYRDFIELLAAHNSALAEQGLLGPAARRNALLDSLTAQLAASPPPHAFIAAGITTAAPAVARLLKQVARLPKGQVILPHIDLAMANQEWDSLGPHQHVEGEPKRRDAETHPQFHLKLLLEEMAVGREEIGSFGAGKASAALNATVASAFGNAAGSEDWQTLPPAIRKMPHVRALVAQDVAEEAKAIAILIRQALEVPEKRVALLTPDRELAVRVAAQLGRWNILVDDSAGRPLLQTRPATLLLALADVCADDFGPVSLLGLLKHPLVRSGDERPGWLDDVRALDIVLRGPRIGVGLSAIDDAIIAQTKEGPRRDSLRGWWAGVAEQLKPYANSAGQRLVARIAQMTALAEQLSGGAVWKGEAGRQLARVVEALIVQDLSPLDDVSDDALPALLARLLESEVVRPAYGRHPRVSIWGLLEARMQRADMVICAGLNEGKWPQHPQPDPWLPPRLRRELKLPGLERNIGLSAHDLASALGASEVVLSRARRDRSGPTIASRFWLRIEALLGANLRHEEDAVGWANRLDEGAAVAPAPRPRVFPNAEQRRVEVSVTQVDTLKTDPYSFYASKILRLKALRQPGTEPDFAWRGTMIHDLLENWAIADNCAEGKLLARADSFFADPVINPVLRTLWQPRIKLALAWSEDEIARLSEEGRHYAKAEKWGNTELAGIRLSGKVDRIDRLADGSLVVVDYKSGSAPSTKQIEAGFASQLGLLGLIAQNSGFDGLRGAAGNFEYWTLNKNKKNNVQGFGERKVLFGKKNTDPDAPLNFVTEAAQSAQKAFEDYLLGTEPFLARLHPEYARYGDYDQLMRLAEWEGRDGA
jgi:ATP-dependent helicase/nuclease subunit B